MLCPHSNTLARRWCPADEGEPPLARDTVRWREATARASEYRGSPPAAAHCPALAAWNAGLRGRRSMSAGESSGCTKLIGDLRKALSGDDAAKPAAVNRCAVDGQVHTIGRF